MRYKRSTAEGATYFFTVVTEGRRKLLAEAANTALLWAALAKVRERRPFDSVAYAILPDHIHMIWSLPDGDSDFATRVRQLKEGFTKPFVKSYGSLQTSPSRKSKGEQAIWQRRYWEHLIRDERDLQTHVDYIHFNPVRHGLVASPADWPASSFGEWVARGVYSADWTLRDDSLAHRLAGVE